MSHCQVCQSVRKSAQPAPLMPWEYASRPWQRIHVDFASFKQQSCLVVTDSYSKWLEVVPMKSTTSERTVEELRSMCGLLGYSGSDRIQITDPSLFLQSSGSLLEEMELDIN